MKIPANGQVQRPLTRREMLKRGAVGFGGIALTSLLQDQLLGQGTTQTRESHGRPHHRPRVRSVIFLYMDGGPSGVDTFDPKPLLAKENGKPFKMKMEPTQFNNNGNTLASPWKFKRYGQSGIEVSDLFPHVGSCVDDLAIIRSMTAEFSEHTTGNYFLHTGHGLQGRPSMGAWVTYGLGSPNHDLPGFVVLNGGLTPPGGVDNFASGFLSAKYQASIFKPGGLPMSNVVPSEKPGSLQTSKLSLIDSIDRACLKAHGSSSHLEAAIANYELAARMQTAVPDLTDIRDETEATKRLYGFEHSYPQTRSYGAQCLLARRLVERGVRFIELTCPNVGGDRWDQHNNLASGHANNARAVDQPIAGLLKDLKARGLLDQTLVIWTGEFGRTPFAQGRNGRDHNPYGFSLWMAGGGIRGGTVYGATDEYGYKAVEGRTTFRDLHATMLHLLGIDHKRLTYRYSGRDIRLTDVEGELIHPILT